MMTTALSFLSILLGLCFITGGHSLANTNINVNVNSPSQQKELLILGLGKVGLEVARQATPHFLSVAGTVRDTPAPPSTDTDTDTDGQPTPTQTPSPSARDGMTSTVMQRIPCQLSEILPRLSDTSHVLVTIPAAAAAAAVSGEEGEELNAVFDAVVQGLTPGSWLGLLSTTGVYGNYDGDWVTEESKCRPAPDSSASRCLEYEAAWCRRAVKHGHRLSIFRCAGIYGPTRSALHTVFQKGMPLPSSTPPKISESNSDSAKPVLLDLKGLTNRIHEEDLAACVVASMLLEKGKEESEINPMSAGATLYNLADDQPESRGVVLEYASDLLKSIRVPVQTRSSVAAEGMSGRARRRRTDVKRVGNQKMKDVLLRHLQYPTYKEGLETILNDPDSPWQPNPNTQKVD
jgi:nucleoside-diphosphate-sugar epimerase